MRIRFVVASLAVTVVVAAAGGASSAHAEDVATVVVAPKSVAAGDPVTVSGRCPAFNTRVYVSAGFDVAQGDLNGWAQTTVAADHTYSVALTIPDESPAGRWIFYAQCNGGDAMSYAGGPVYVDVTAGHGPPLRFSVAPDPLVTGHTVDVNGTGCEVGGRALDLVRIRLLDGNHFDRDFGSVERAPDRDGSFRASIDLYDVPYPENHPVTVAVDCIDNGDAQQGWERVAHRSMKMVAPPDTSTTTSTVTVAPASSSTGPTSPMSPTTSVSVAAAVQLPRTGSANRSLSATAVAFVVLGCAVLGVVRPSRKRH